MRVDQAGEEHHRDHHDLGGHHDLGDEDDCDLDDESNLPSMVSSFRNMSSGQMLTACHGPCIKMRMMAVVELGLEKDDKVEELVIDEQKIETLPGGAQPKMMIVAPLLVQDNA